MLKMKINTGANLAVAAFLLGSLAARAQSTSAATPVPTLAAANRYEVAVDFISAYAGRVVNQNTFWLTSGSAEFAARVHRNLSVAANFSGLTTNNTGKGVPLSLFVYTFGPRYTYQLPQYAGSHKVLFFDEFLAGEAHGFNSLFPGPSSASFTANSLALQATGGADVAVMPRLSLRVLQVGWLRTQVPDAFDNVENNIQLGAGITFHSKGK